VTAPRFVDLQVHSTASDGVLPPAAVVQAAQIAGLEAIALTDHDSMAGVPEAEEAGRTLGVRIVPGVELSALYDGDEYHLLGLLIDDRDRIESRLRLFREERVQRAERIVAVLNHAGIPVTLDAVLQEAGSGAVGRPHVARALMAGGWVRDFREAFDRWLGWGKPAYVEKGGLGIDEAITLVHQAGGLVVWAHPGDAASEVKLGRLRQIGMDAVEVLHPSHPQALAERIFDRAERLGLLPSGGSDWHGGSDSYRQLGGQMVPAAWLDRMDETVAERRR
jgi:predicted metal-dependent phosphoesterase TrpH